MDTRIQTSFIPKSPIGTPMSRSHFSGLGAFFVLAIVVFAGTVGYTGFTFLQEKNIRNQIIAQQEKIDDTKRKLDQTLVEKIVRTDKRIRVANTLLQNHIAITPLIETIKAYTLQTVQFTNFDYGRVTGGVQLRMKGEAASFRSVALQSDVLKDIKVFKDPFISDLVTGEDGTVSFSLTATLKSGELLYKNTLPSSTNTESSAPTTPPSTNKPQTP